MEQKFIAASRQALRFPSPKGDLTVEDLWALPLSSNTGKANLDDIACDLNRKLKEKQEESFVKEVKCDNTLQLSFDIVKYIIDTRLAENARASEDRVRAEQRQKVLSIISDKENQELSGKSIEELKQLAESLKR